MGCLRALVYSISNQVAFIISAGEYEQAVKHLTNAVVVCGQPQQLLQTFHSFLPEHVFQMLVDNLNSIQSAAMQVSEK